MSTTRLDRMKVEAEFNRLVEDYDLKGLRLGWNERLRTTLGRHKPVLGIVELATFVATDDALDTLRHEIAHALTPSDADPHGEEWRAACETLGIPPEPCGNVDGWEARQEPIRWYTRCPICGIEVGYMRMPRSPKRCSTTMCVFLGPLPLRSAVGERWFAWWPYETADGDVARGRYIDMPQDTEIFELVYGAWI